MYFDIETQSKDRNRLLKYYIYMSYEYIVYLNKDENVLRFRELLERKRGYYKITSKNNQSNITQIGYLV